MEPTFRQRSQTVGTLTLIRYGGETVKSLSTSVVETELVMNEISLQ